MQDKQEDSVTTLVTTSKPNEDQLSTSSKRKVTLMVDEDAKKTPMEESFKSETNKKKFENTSPGEVAHNVERKSYPLFKVEKEFSGEDSDKDAQVLKILQEMDEQKRSKALGGSSSSYISTSHSSASSSDADDGDHNAVHDAKYLSKNNNNTPLKKKAKKYEEKAKEREKMKIMKHRQRLEDKIEMKLELKINYLSQFFFKLC